MFQCGPLDTLDTIDNEAADNYNTNAEPVIDNYISCGKSVEVMRTEPSPVSKRKDADCKKPGQRHQRKESRETAAFGDFKAQLEAHQDQKPKTKTFLRKGEKTGSVLSSGKIG